MTAMRAAILLALTAALGCSSSSGPSPSPDSGSVLDATGDAPAVPEDGSPGADGAPADAAVPDGTLEDAPADAPDDAIADAGSGDAIADAAPVVQHLYVDNDNTNGGVSRFELPLTPDASADFTIPGENTVDVAFDPGGNMIAADNAGQLAYYPAPITASSTPSVGFANGTEHTNGQIAFAPSGTTLFAATQGAVVNEFDVPFGDAGVPARTLGGVDSGLSNGIGLTFDPAGNLYAASFTRIFVYAPPYTGAPLITPAAAGKAYRKMVVLGSQLFIGSVSGPDGGNEGEVDVYDLPLTSASTPAFAITQGMATPEALSTDARGNLYVGNLSTATVSVYAPPFSVASAPAVSLQVGPPATHAVFGVTVGP